MSGILDDWRSRHPVERGSWFRLVVLVGLLALVIIFITNSGRIADSLGIFLNYQEPGEQAR
jgi:hypothetical protein